jgi:predicted dehydrogenase
MRFLQLVCFLVFINLSMPTYAQSKTPLRIAVAGLTHTHVHWIFNSAKRGEIEIVGIAEPNRELAIRYARQYNISEDKLFTSLGLLIEKVKPQAVAAFNSIFEHLEVVQLCAPKGIHVMVEKPLAVSLDHARKMEALAKKHSIYLLTNYETTWYSSMEATYKMVQEEKAIGPVVKMVVHDGHQGPKEIGVDKEFLDWLTDPKFNGAGALMDFGCYGANLATWLLQGEKPVSVTAVTRQIKPEVYPKVDDDATIVLAYPSRQVVIQASWNWPFSRKDLEVYGKTGTIFAPDRSRLVYRISEKEKETTKTVENLKAPYDDPFAYFAAVVQGTIRMEEFDLSGLPVNMIVMEILDAAIRSAKAGKTIYLQKSKL